MCQIMYVAHGCKVVVRNVAHGHKQVVGYVAYGHNGSYGCKLVLRYILHCPTQSYFRKMGEKLIVSARFI